MRQGQAGHVDYKTKTEPRSRAVSETAVSQMGTALGNHAMDSNGRILRGASRPLYEGRGLEAPMNGSQSHHCGSQGKY
jgi:hypothetical protein